jgi:hypothetical protein
MARRSLIMASTLLFLPLALAAGALLTVQASANLQLSKQTGSPFVDRHSNSPWGPASSSRSRRQPASSPGR